MNRFEMLAMAQINLARYDDAGKTWGNCCFVDEPCVTLIEAVFFLNPVSQKFLQKECSFNLQWLLFSIGELKFGVLPIP